VVDIQWCLDRLMVRRSIRRIVVGLATFLAVLCVGTIVVRRYLGLETPLAPHIVTVVMLIVWAYLLFGLPFERAWLARRHYRRNAAEYLETQVTLSLEQVTIVNEVLRSDFRWSLVKLIAHTPAGILFCNSAPQALVWLPDRLFEDKRLREQVLRLAEINKVQVKRLV
jgi:hypothetical protein